MPFTQNIKNDVIIFFFITQKQYLAPLCLRVGKTYHLLSQVGDRVDRVGQGILYSGLGSLFVHAVCVVVTVLTLSKLGNPLGDC